MLNNIYFYIFFTLFAFGISSSANSQNKQIEIKQAQTLEYDEQGGIKARKLVGNVILVQEQTILYCDSALLFTESNVADAYGNVKIENPNQLLITANFLRYQGNIKQAILEKNVTLTDGLANLKTEKLFFDNQNKVAYYRNGAIITDNQGSLTSVKGTYKANERMFYFKDSVQVRHQDLTLDTDTLNYHYDSKTAYFVAPTYFFANQGQGFTKSGFMNNTSKQTLLMGDAFLVDSTAKRLQGDTIFFDDIKKTGYAKKNVALIDTAEKLIIHAEHAIFDRKINKNTFFEDALLVQYDQTDTLFIIADTLMSYKPDSLQSIFAYNQVRGKRNDLLFTCDSLVYAELDSSFRFFTNPIIWSTPYQLTADSMHLFTKSGKISQLKMRQNCFLGQQAKDYLYNQIKGRSMDAFFEEQELDRHITNGNAESLYWAQDDDKAFVGATKIVASSITIKMEHKEPATILFKPKPKGVMHPINKIELKSFNLDGFEIKQLEKEQTEKELADTIKRKYP